MGFGSSGGDAVVGEGNGASVASGGVMVGLSAGVIATGLDGALGRQLLRAGSCVAA